MLTITNGVRLEAVEAFQPWEAAACVRMLEADPAVWCTKDAKGRALLNVLAYVATRGEPSKVAIELAISRQLHEAAARGFDCLALDSVRLKRVLVRLREIHSRLLARSMDVERASSYVQGDLLA